MRLRWDFARLCARRQTLKATLQQHLVAGRLKCSLRSSLVSSQGAASRRLPNGCGWELRGLRLYKDQGTVSGVRRTAGGRPRHLPYGAMRANPLDPRRDQGPSGATKCLCHVLEEGAYHCVPPRTAATYQHHAGKRAPCHVHKYVHGENGVQPQRPSPVVVVCPSPRESTTSGKGPIPKGTVKNRGNRKAGPRDGALEREKQPHQPRSNQATGPASKSDQQAEGTGQSQFELTRHPSHAGAGM